MSERIPDTHHCPYCELVFFYMTEVRDHVIHDHREHADVVQFVDPHEMPRP